MQPLNDFEKECIVAGVMNGYDWLCTQYTCTCDEAYKDRDLIDPHCTRCELDSWHDIMLDQMDDIAQDRLMILDGMKPAINTST